MDPQETQESASSFNDNSVGNTEKVSQDLGAPAPSSPIYNPTSDRIYSPAMIHTRKLRLSSDLALPTSPAFLRTKVIGETSLAYPSSDPINTRYDLNSQHSLHSHASYRNRRGDVPVSNQMQGFLSSQADVPNPQMHTTLTSDPTAVQRNIWGTNIDISESMAMFKDFIANFTKAHYIRYTCPDDIIINDSDNLPFYDHYLSELLTHRMMEMNLDCTNLKSYEPSRKLYYQLIRYPQELIPLLDHTLTDIFLEKFQECHFNENDMMNVRPFNLDRSVNLRELDPSDIDQLVTVKGLLIRASPIIPDLKTGFFRCSVCEQTVAVENDRGTIKEPTICPRNACKSKNSMRLIHNRSIFSNKQILRLQETPDEIPDGQTPYTVSMYVYDGLVDVSKPGDRIEVTGIFRGVPVRENMKRRAVKALFKTFVDVVHIKRVDKKRVGIDSSIRANDEHVIDFIEGDCINQEDPEEEEKIIQISHRQNLYELLAGSIAPSIFGLDDVKKGILLQVFGGTNKFNKNKPGAPRIRGELNVLLVGDPGVAKSQLLQYVHKLAPRGVYTSGKGSSAVGLTAYVTRDPDTRQIVLESGALVLSDGGICCIDEFDKMTDSTRSVLHEVMEQQTISVAKAGIITTLNARTSILACANPINSKFDVGLSVSQNVNLPPPLMSRFDLLYLVLDKPNERDDRRLAQHLVGLFMTDKPKIQASKDFIPLEMFTKYVNYAKQKIHPCITKEAGEALASYYVSMRKSGHSGGFNVVSFTTRQLESMIRLAEAHAKMRLSPTVEVSDVDEANRLILSALQTAAMDPRTGRIDLDLVITGISANSRIVREQKRSALRDLIKSTDKSSLKWAEVYRLFVDQSDPHISERDFNGMLQDLCDEEVIHMTGRSNAEKMIRKLKL